MENFMNKLAEKISAQDIIKANSQAEAKETERIRQEAEQYKAQTEELKRATEEYKTLLEDMRKDSSEYRQQISDMREETRAFVKGLEELRDDTKDYKNKLEENDEKIHDVGVQIYRNVQAVVEKGQTKTSDGFKDVFYKLEALQVAVETKNSSLMPLIVITMLIALADLVLNILRLIGII